MKLDRYKANGPLPARRSHDGLEVLCSYSNVSSYHA